MRCLDDVVMWGGGRRGAEGSAVQFLAYECSESREKTSFLEKRPGTCINRLLAFPSPGSHLLTLLRVLCFLAFSSSPPSLNTKTGGLIPLLSQATWT